ncbi:hypothetical protein HRbin15_01986 [bacterium HR15]|nr:hypothetical protein HRbin15_01986 [bacterium HR15]
MVFQPNRLLTHPINRYLAEILQTIGEYELLLRPARRFVFHSHYRPSAYIPEFNKPCLGVLVAPDDLEKRPYMVLETEPNLSEALREAYRECEILWLEVYEGPAGIHMNCEIAGIRLEMATVVPHLATAIQAPLALLRARYGRVPIPPGRLVQSFHERLLREAIDCLALQYAIACHHQVPFGFVTGYRANMPPPIARSAVDMVITLSLRVNPDGLVLLPINLNLHNAHQENEQTAVKDRLITEFAQSIGMPMLIIRAAEGADAYLFSCTGLELEPIRVEGRAPADWADAIRVVLEAAFQALDLPREWWYNLGGGKS